MAKLSDTYPTLVGKKYCGDCLFLLMHRMDGVVTGDMNTCHFSPDIVISRHSPPCKRFLDKTEIIAKQLAENT